MKSKKPRRRTNDLVPRIEVVSGRSFVLVASSCANALKSNLYWSPTDASGEPFIFSLEIPDGEDGLMVIPIPMGLSQAQAVYEAHPRRVRGIDLPPECPLMGIEKTVLIPRRQD